MVSSFANLFTGLNCRNMLGAILAIGLFVVLLLYVFQEVFRAYPNVPRTPGAGGTSGQNQAGPNAGAGGPGGASVLPVGVPRISERFFDTGTSHSSVTGALALGGDLPIDTVASYVSNQGRATIVFGAPDPNALLLQVTFNEPEDTVTVIQGDRRVTGSDDDCVFNVTVTETLVAGHISCPFAEAFNGEESLGTASIELDFSGGSLSSRSSDGGAGDPTPID